MNSVIGCGVKNGSLERLCQILAREQNYRYLAE
jgi:hypothetical protein